LLLLSFCHYSLRDRSGRWLILLTGLAAARFARISLKISLT
jgi:hypothetical protein